MHKILDVRTTLCSWKRRVQRIGQSFVGTVRCILYRYSIERGFLCYPTDVTNYTRVVVPHDDSFITESPLMHMILLSLDIWDGKRLTALRFSATGGINGWSLMCTYETFQLVKTSAHSAASLVSLPVPIWCWKFINTSFCSVFP